MASFSTVSAGQEADSSQLNQIIDALDGNANIPISISGVNDASNYALTIKNADAANTRVFRGQDSSGATRFDLSGSTAAVRADPDGTGLSVVATIAHTQTLTNKTLSSVTLGAPVVISGSSQVIQMGNNSFISAVGGQIGDKYAVFSSTGPGYNVRLFGTMDLIGQLVAMRDGSNVGIFRIDNGTVTLDHGSSGVWGTVSSTTSTQSVVFWNGGNNRAEFIELSTVSSGHTYYFRGIGL